MIEIRLHGRGGQGTVVAAKILADAVSREGKFVQAFPEYGVERRGAPVKAFLRIDDEIIYIKSEIYEPDHLVILEPSLIGAIDLIYGLKEGGWIIINTNKDPEEMEFAGNYRIATVPATKIARKFHLGSEAAPIVNTAILGGVVKVLDLCDLETLKEAVKEGVPLKEEANLKASEEAFNETKGGNNA
ncbi:MAG: 2-oxoacid:acceptor oxidoreductase family protein [candidate division WOR-3 bacterium]|nr:2-oxoacid:acceptor oxidoreductase family protein [candidate division WOR-3 bacterium]